ncbi:MAG: UvrB/UvrC motif-containing protein [Bacteroidales bacterium]
MVSSGESGNLNEPSSKYSSLSDEELYKLIDDAVKTEDYERAASIRDELEKRKKKNE